jgi:hypothetical protein
MVGVGPRNTEAGAIEVNEASKAQADAVLREPGVEPRFSNGQIAVPSSTPRGNIPSDCVACLTLEGPILRGTDLASAAELYRRMMTRFGDGDGAAMVMGRRWRSRRDARAPPRHP